MYVFPSVRAGFEVHVETVWAHTHTHYFHVYCSDIQVCSCFYSNLFWSVVAHFFDLTSHNFVATFVEIITSV
jgi:hypothetical protein